MFKFLCFVTMLLAAMVSNVAAIDAAATDQLDTKASDLDADADALEAPHRELQGWKGGHGYYYDYPYYKKKYKYYYGRGRGRYYYGRGRGRGRYKRYGYYGRPYYRRGKYGYYGKPYYYGGKGYYGKHHGKYDD